MRIRFRKPREPRAEPDAPSQNAGQTNSTTAKTPATVQAPGAAAATEAKPSADPQEQIDGLRAWLADLDRKLGLRTYIGGALALLALAAAGVALFLTLSLKQDAATKDDLNAMRDQLSSVEQFAATAAHKGVNSLDQRLTELETRVDKLSTDQTTSKRELQVIQDDIKELRSQVSGGTGAPGTGSFGGGTGAGTGAGLGDAGTGAGSTGSDTGGTGQ